MEFFKPNTNINFMGQRKVAAIFSALVFFFSITILIINGLNLGLDFTGGTQIELKYQQPANLETIRTQLNTAGFPEAVVQPYGSPQEVLIRVGEQKSMKQQTLQTMVMKALPGASVQQMQFIGPQVGKTLMTNGVLAVIVSLLGTMLYIALRFEYRFAISAALALIHDPILILGVFSLLHVEFNLIVLAAILTIIGYSLNDTVVVYDRIRENFRTMRKADTIDVVNSAINQTLSRTIMTSGLTLLVVIVLLFFGGETLRGFSLALTIGIVIGTYSSIYIAGAAAVAMGLDRKHLLPPKKNDLTETP